MMGNNKRIALNFIYLARHHAGGKDQVAINLLHGFLEGEYCENLVVICYDYLSDTIRDISEDITIEVVPYHGGKTEISRLLDILRVNTIVVPAIIKKYNIDLIFHASCTNGLCRFKVPSIMIPHDIKAVSHRVMGNVKIGWFKHLLYKIMYHTDFRHADKIIAISDTDKSEIMKYYPKYADKVVRIYNPVRVAVPEEAATSEKPQDIVAINLQFHHKNIITLIRAFEQVKDQLDCNLLLVGNVPERVSYLKDYVATHDLSERVIFTGFLSGKKKRHVLLNCALYVNCSLFEGFGMTAVEAMILKVPTLVSKIPANYEVTQGLCRYYEPTESESALAQAMVNALQSPDTTGQLEVQSKEMLKMYDYKKIAHEYMELFISM